MKLTHHDNNDKLYKRIILIDGTNYMYRYFFASTHNSAYSLRTSSDIPTNAIVTFIRFLYGLMQQENVFQYYIAFDGPKKTWRSKILPEYKAKRDKTPNDLLVQFNLMFEFLNAIKMPYFVSDEDEADDVIASLAKKATANGYYVSIYSNDQDLLQLVNDHVEVIRKKDDVVNLTNFASQYGGLAPYQIIDRKALAGDPSDNIPGLSKVGEKTAVSLLRRFDSISNIYANFDNLTVREKKLLLNQEELVNTFKKIVTLNVNVDVNKIWTSNEYALDDYDLVKTFFTKYEMSSVARQFLPVADQKQAAQKKLFKQVVKVSSPSMISSKQPWIILLHQGFATKNLLGFYVILGKTDPLKTIYYCSKDDFFSNLDWIKVFSNHDIKKIFYSTETTLNALFEKDIFLKLANWDDMHLLFYLQDTNLSCTLKNLHHNFQLNAIDHFNYDEIMTSNQSHDVNINNYYHCALAQIYYALYQKAQLFLTNSDNKLIVDNYYNIELPLTLIIRTMENNGVLVDSKFLITYKKNVDKKLSQISNEVFALAGYEFNINAPKQVFQLLDAKLNLFPVNHKKTSVDAETLLTLINKHPVVSLILEYRKLKKLQTTYLISLLDHVDANGVIYPHFHQTVTATGRLSSSSPNLQNIVVKDSAQRQMRKGIIARPSNFLVSYDYNQIELRILAHFSKSAFAIKALNSGTDFHLLTASKLFNSSNPTPAQRSFAKTLTYSIIYGIEAFTIARQFNIYHRQAEQIINDYYKMFPEFLSFKNKTFEIASEVGYVDSLMHHRRFVRAITSKNKNISSRWKRIAFNSVIQATAADIIKMAMLNIATYLSENNLNFRLLAQIHDELIYELDNSYQDSDHLHQLRKIMEDAVALTVKLTVNMQTGTNWYDLKFA